MKFIAMKIVSLLVLSLLPYTSRAQWHPDPAVNTPVAIDPAALAGAVTAPDGQGGVFVVWQNGNRIYGQYLNKNGIPQWKANGVMMSDTTANAWSPCCISDSAGGIVVAWALNNSTVQVKRYTGAGQELWDTRLLNWAVSTDDNLRMTTDLHNGAYVTAPVASQISGLYVQRIRANGQLAWLPHGLKLAQFPFTATNQCIISDGMAGAYVAWIDKWGSPLVKRIFTQRVDSTATMGWPLDSAIILRSSRDQDAPRLGLDGYGGVFVAFTEYRPNFGPSSYAIMVQRLRANGSQCFDTSTAFVAAYPSVYPMLAKALGAGKMAVMFTTGYTNPQTYIQAVDTNGTPLWNSGIPVPVMDSASAGGFVLDESGEIFAICVKKAGGGNHHIRVQKFSATGAPLWPAAGKPVGTAIGAKLLDGTVSRNDDHAGVLSDDNGGFIAVWSESRLGNTMDLYANRLHPDGTTYPVELLSFSASVSGASVQLHWSTLSESSHYGFEVQRSVNSETWERLGFVAAKGVGGQGASYAYSDGLSPDYAAGTALSYRLRQIDFNGAYEYSPVVQVDLASSIDAFAIHSLTPNPVADMAELRFALSSPGPVEMSVTNTLGQVLYRHLLGSYTRGEHIAVLPTALLKPGIYFVRIQSGDAVHIARMVKR